MTNEVPSDSRTTTGFVLSDPMPSHLAYSLRPLFLLPLSFSPMRVSFPPLPSHSRSPAYITTTSKQFSTFPPLPRMPRARGAPVGGDRAPAGLTTARDREQRSAALGALLGSLAVRPLNDDEAGTGGCEAEEPEASASPSSLPHSTTKSTGRHHGSHNNTMPRPLLGGGAIITSTGRPVVLSAGSRRLPAVFREQQALSHGIDLALTDVQQTLKTLNYDFFKTKDTALPHELLQAVEADHQSYLNALDSQTRLSRGGEAPGQRKGRARRTAAETLDGLVDDASNNSDNRHGCTERQWMRLVSQAREAAADDGYDDTQSVANYAAEPDVPRSLQGQTLRSLLLNAEVDCTKTEPDLDVLTTVTNSRDTVWWESALLTREVKAHTVRANYHLRRAQRWVWRARESMLLQSTYLNQFSEQNRKDLVRLREQLEAFTQRVQDSEAATAELQKELVELQAQVRFAVDDRAARQEELVDLAHAANLLAPGDDDPLRAEALLLLNQMRFSPELSEHVGRVMQWLRENPVALEV